MKSLVRLTASTPMQLDELGQLATAEQVLKPRNAFPELFDKAASQDGKTDGCPVRDGIKHAAQQHLAARRDQVFGDKSLDVWMTGDTRLHLCSLLFQKYMPRNALQSLDQLPALLQVFLMHLDQSARREMLECWPKQAPSQHIVSGIWIGLPNRPLSVGAAAMVESKSSNMELQSQGLMMGAYIYLRTLLVSRLRVAGHFVDGLLTMALGTAIVEQWSKSRMWVLEQHGPVKTVWAETWQTLSPTLLQLEEEARMVRRVLFRLGEPPNRELEAAFKVGLAFQHMHDSKVYQRPKRVWSARSWRALSESEIHYKLASHCAATGMLELANFKDLHFLEVLDGTTAGSVANGLGGAHCKSVWCVPLTSDASKTQAPSTLLGIPAGILWAYTRWASFKTTANNRQYAFSPQVLQLLSAADGNKHQAWTYAVDIMRQWLGMPALPLPESPDLHATQVDFFHSTLFYVLDKIEDPRVAALLVPYMLSFCDDELTIRDRESTIKDSVMSTGSFSKLGDQGDWYFVMEKVMGQPLAQALEFLRAKVAITGGDRGEVGNIRLVKQHPDVDSPFNKARLATQKERARPSRFVAADAKCQCADSQRVHQNLLVLLMILEQMGPKKTGQEIPIVRLNPGAIPFGSCRDGCVLYSDYPISWARTERGSHEIYADSTFGVYDLDYVGSGAGDVSDLYLFYRAKFGGHIEESMFQDMAKYPPREIPVEFAWNQQQQPSPQKKRKFAADAPTPPLPGKNNNNKSNKRQRLTVTTQRKETVIKHSIEWSPLGSSLDIASPL